MTKKPHPSKGVRHEPHCSTLIAPQRERRSEAGNGASRHAFAYACGAHSGVVFTGGIPEALAARGTSLCMVGRPDTFPIDILFSVPYRGGAVNTYPAEARGRRQSDQTGAR